VNDTFLKKLGFTREQEIGKTAFELNFWVEPERLAEATEILPSKGTWTSKEVLVPAANGSILTEVLAEHPVEIGGVRHVLIVGGDITERKLGEAELRVTHERLRQSEERFSKIFRNRPALVVLTRLRDGQFVATNEAFLRATGFGEA